MLDFAITVLSRSKAAVVQAARAQPASQLGRIRQRAVRRLVGSGRSWSAGRDEAPAWPAPSSISFIVLEILGLRWRRPQPIRETLVAQFCSRCRRRPPRRWTTSSYIASALRRWGVEQVRSGSADLPCRRPVIRRSGLFGAAVRCRRRGLVGSRRGRSSRRSPAPAQAATMQRSPRTAGTGELAFSHGEGKVEDVQLTPRRPALERCCASNSITDYPARSRRPSADTALLVGGAWRPTSCRPRSRYRGRRH